EADRPFGRRIPQGQDIGDPHPEAVAIEVSARRVVAEPRGGHTHLGRAGAQSEEVLSDADRRAADQLCESLALLSKELRPIRGSEASVQADLRAPLGQGAE